MNATARPVYKSNDSFSRSPEIRERLQTEEMNDYANDYDIVAPNASQFQSQMVNRSKRAQDEGNQQIQNPEPIKLMVGPIRPSKGTPAP